MRTDLVARMKQPAPAPWRQTIAKMVRGAVFAALAGHVIAASALMAGDPPDHPRKRVDPNMAESIWSGVGAVVHRNGAVFSGALIRRRFALTAAHVVAGAKPGDLGFHLNSRSGSKNLAVRRIILHPLYRGQTRPFTFFDAALIELADPVGPGVTVYRTHDAPVSHGSVLTFVGYGASGFGSSGPTVKANRLVRRVGKNTLDYFVKIPAQWSTESPKGLFLYDFDGPDQRTNVMGGPSLGGTIETSAAAGDSGAPVFVNFDGCCRLAGLLTFVADLNNRGAQLSHFGAAGGGILIWPLLDWIESVTGQP